MKDKIPIVTELIGGGFIYRESDICQCGHGNWDHKKTRNGKWKCIRMCFCKDFVSKVKSRKKK
jgi:hypothetical protein